MKESGRQTVMLVVGLFLVVSIFTEQASSLDLTKFRGKKPDSETIKNGRHLPDGKKWCLYYDQKASKRFEVQSQCPESKSNGDSVEGFEQTNKLAFFFMVHKDEEQFKRLFDHLYNSEDYFLVHMDQKSPKKFKDAVKKLAEGKSNVKTSDKFHTGWGTFDIVKAEQWGMQEMVKMGRWDYWINLSGADYPLKPVSELRSFLQEHGKGKMFIDTIDMKECPNYLHRLRKVVHLCPGASSNQAETSNDASSGESNSREWRFHSGAAWFLASRPFCEWFAKNTDRTDDVNKMFRNVVTADELYWQTTLANSPYCHDVWDNHKNVTANCELTRQKVHPDRGGYNLNPINLHFEVWKKAQSHPENMTITQKPLIDKAEAFFGRKVEPKDPKSRELMDVIDRKIEAAAASSSSHAKSTDATGESQPQQQSQNPPESSAAASDVGGSDGGWTSSS